MKNIPNVKVGIVVGSTDWLPMDFAVEHLRKLVEACSEVYEDLDIYECRICVTDNEISVKRAMKDILKAECDAICIYYANYGPESAGSLLAEEFGGPVMVIAAAEEGTSPYIQNRTDGMSGFINACYALKLRNVNVYIPNRPIVTIPQAVKEIRRFCSIARTVVGVRNLKLISIGPRPSSYLASCVPMHPLYKLGVDFSEYSELELYEAYNKHGNDSRIDDIALNMASELGESSLDYEKFRAFAQYEATIEDWIRTHKGDRKYVTVTSTCWPAFPIKFGFVPCYVNSRLTGSGVPVACEVDAYGAVSEFFGQCISGGVVTLLNLNNNVPENVYDESIKGKLFNGKKYQIGDLFIGYHCGVTPSAKLNNPELKPHYVNNLLIGENQAQGTIQGRINESKITLLRIQGSANGDLKAYLAQGQILPIDVETYGGYGVFAVPEMDRFLRNVIIEEGFPNHVVVIFEHCADVAMSTLRQVGITEIYYNHPKEVPYDKEKFFEENREWF